MKVIFIKDLKKQGKKNEIKEVSDGYATNYLIKNGYAVKYTKSSGDRLEVEIENNKKNEEENIKEANKINPPFLRGQRDSVCRKSQAKAWLFCVNVV